MLKDGFISENRPINEVNSDSKQPEAGLQDKKHGFSGESMDILARVSTNIACSQPQFPFSQNTDPVYTELVIKEDDNEEKIPTFQSIYEESYIQSLQANDNRPYKIYSSDITNEIIDILIITTLKLKTPLTALFTAINLFYRYVQDDTDSSDDYLLTALAALSIANKIETSERLPNVSDYVSMIDNRYSEDQLTKREIEIFNTTKISTKTTSPTDFLRYWLPDLKLKPTTYSYIIFTSICSQLSPDIIKMNSEIVASSILSISLSTMSEKLDVDPIKRALEFFGPVKLTKCSQTIVSTIENMISDSDTTLYQVFKQTKDLSFALDMKPLVPKF